MGCLCMWFIEWVFATETCKRSEAEEVGEVVKTHEGSEILSYSQANRLACHGFMNAGRKLGLR